MPKPDYDQKFNLRLPNELYKRVEKLSKTYERSTNEQIVFMLKTWQESASIEGRLARLEEQVFVTEKGKKAVGQ
jgi:archaellum component FlaC